MFKPTYLYIKRHTATGLLYFGKTSRPYPFVETYNGSGKHWQRHFMKHGKDMVETLWYCLFMDKESCNDFALAFSSAQSIVESSTWANLIPEDGLSGGSIAGFNGFAGRKHSATRNKTVSEKLKGHPVSAATRAAVSKAGKLKVGSNNGRALFIHIYDNNGRLRFETHGDFEKVCKEQSLPFLPLKGSYLRGGKPIFTNPNPGKLKDLSMLQFKGWYAMIRS